MHVSSDQPIFELLITICWISLEAIVNSFKFLFETSSPRIVGYEMLFLCLSFAMPSTTRSPLLDDVSSELRKHSVAIGENVGWIRFQPRDVHKCNRQFLDSNKEGILSIALSDLFRIARTTLHCSCHDWNCFVANRLEELVDEDDSRSSSRVREHERFVLEKDSSVDSISLAKYHRGFYYLTLGKLKGSRNRLRLMRNERRKMKVMKRSRKSEETLTSCMDEMRQTLGHLEPCDVCKEWVWQHKTTKTSNCAYIHVLPKCVTSLLGFMCFVLMFLWILVSKLSLVSDVSPFSRKVLHVNFISPRIRNSKYKVLSSGCCSLTLSCHRQLNLYPKFFHISHRENGSFAELSSQFSSCFTSACGNHSRRLQ